MLSQNGSSHYPRTDHDDSSRHPPAGPHPVEQPHARATRRARPQGLLETSALAALLTAYCIFLILGTFVHTARLDRRIADLQFSPEDLFVMLICWTWTNLLILCCLSSAIGEFGRGMLLGSHEPRTVRGATARGFFIFLVIMAGQLTVLGTPEATAVSRNTFKLITSNPDLEADHTHICLQHFFRMAGVASLLSFLTGVDPRLFRKLINYWESIGDREGGMPKGSSSKDGARPQPGGGRVEADTPVGVHQVGVLVGWISPRHQSRLRFRRPLEVALGCSGGTRLGQSIGPSRS